MRILLVQPDYATKGIGFRMAAMTEPLQWEMLAALVPDHDVRILDLRVEANLAATLAEFQPDLVGVTALTPEVYAAVDVLRRAKAFSPDVFTVAGGHHATLLPDDLGARSAWAMPTRRRSDETRGRSARPVERCRRA